MSVHSEIDRIAGAKSDIATAITNKGVTVPSGTKLDGMAALINSIESGGSGGNGIRIEVDNYSRASIFIESSKGQSGKLKPSGGLFHFDNLSDGSSLTISSVKYDSMIFYFYDNGYIDGGAFPNEEYTAEIMNAAEEFMNTTVMGICSSYGFTNPDTIEIGFDESSGKPVIIIM